MFTGIIEDLAKIKYVEKLKDFCSFEILSSISNELKIGDSVSINGVCLTVVNVKYDSFTVNIIKETLNKSSLGTLNANDFVNIERAMKVSARLDGHIVQGHVESTGLIVNKSSSNNQTNIEVEINRKLIKYCIKKGSIALDGISLTIANINDNKLMVALIPHTLKNTNLKYKKVGDLLNLETDVFARHVENILKNNKYE